MPKITTQVARQRYARVTVMEPDPDKPGEERPKRIIVNKKRRRGDAPIYKVVKTNDKSQPLPPRKCEKCGAELTIGKEYRSIGIKQQFGGIVRYRCMNCPIWQPHEYSNANWARVAQLQAEHSSIDNSSWDSLEDAQATAQEIAEAIRELATEKQESLDNMPEGLQQGDTGQALEQFVQDLEEWADRVENAPDNADDFPEGECQNCHGEELTHDEHSEDCPEDCDGTEECLECNGSNEGEATEEEIDAWREEVATAIQDELDNAAEWQG
jgi:hypothetical protein